MQDSDDIFHKQCYREEIIIAIVSFLLTLLLHIALLKIIPSKWNLEKPQSEEMAIEILPPKLERKSPEFIEANPYGNELKPQKVVPESFKNQRVADELPEKNSKSSRPFVKGEDKKYKKIVSGTSDKSDLLNPTQVTKVLERPLTEHTRKEQNATPQKQSSSAQASKQLAQSTSKKLATKTESNSTKKVNESARLAKPDKIDAILQGESSEIIKVPTIAKAETDTTKNVENKFTPSANKSEKIAKEISPFLEREKPEIKELKNIPAPRPRPRLSMKIPAGPLLDNNKASSNAGIVSVDSRFSEFGAYQQRMIEAISRQWNLLGSRYDLSSAYGSQVMVEFSLNTEGELVNFRIVYSTSTNTGTGLCEQAIQTTAPYGVWTQEMVNVFGAQPQQVRINFLYR